MVWGSPGRYIQGPGELMRLPQYTAQFGPKIFAVIDQFFYEELCKELGKLYVENGGAFQALLFDAEVTEAEIARISEIARGMGPSVVVGIGGGKTMDTAKAVADDLQTPLVIAPTTASTDAPTAALSAIYQADGKRVGTRWYRKNPELVLVDSQVIAKAPVRFLVSGMGDALATVFEARACAQTDVPVILGREFGKFRRTRTAMAIAQACYDTLLENGLKAKCAAERGLVTEELEAVIEANILMSGLGFENTGVAAAHSICEGLAAISEVGGKSLHGEQVAFGLICQLVVENAPGERFDEVLGFMHDVGLPMTLRELGIEPTKTHVRLIAEASLKAYWRAQPQPVTVEAVMDLVFTADALGRKYQESIAN